MSKSQEFYQWQVENGMLFMPGEGAIIGYGDPEPVRMEGPSLLGPGEFGLPDVPMPILSSELDFSTFDEEDLALLAVDLMVVGVYDDVDYMFDDDMQVKPDALASAVERAIDLASVQADRGLGTDFLDVLMRNSDRSPEELRELLAEKKAEARSGGGRVINYIDPVALMDAAKKSTASVTGRMATPEQQQAFVKMIHGLQASGATSIDVGARAEAFAREQAPEEAKAMDYAGAAGVLMQALGIRR